MNEKERTNAPTRSEIDTRAARIQTSCDACLIDADEDEDRRCGPATGDVALDDAEDAIDDGSSARRDGAGGGNDKGESSSARVPEPSRYSLPRHFTVDEPVNALK